MKVNDTEQVKTSTKVNKLKDRLTLALAIFGVIGVAVLFIWTANTLGIEQEYRDHYYSTALDYAASGSYHSAVQNLAVFLKHVPDDENGNYEMGLVLMQLNKPLEARPYFVQTYNLDRRKIHRLGGGLGRQYACQAMIKKIDQMTQNKQKS